MTQSQNKSHARSRFDWPTFWPNLVIALIGSGVIGLAVAWATVQIQQSAAADAAAIATCDNPQQLRLADPVNASANSELSYAPAGGQSLNYPAGYLVDGSRQTAWIADSASDGVGAELTIQLASAEDVRLICLLNGYAKTGAVFDANGTVRVLAISTDAGSRDAAVPRVTVDNFFNYQQLIFAPGVTETVKLTVLAADVPAASQLLGPTSAAISEIEIWVKE